jgi:hypothetical protein
MAAEIDLLRQAAHGPDSAQIEQLGLQEVRDRIQKAESSFFFSATGCNMTLDESGSAGQLANFYQQAFGKAPYEFDGYEASTGP